MKCIVKGCHNKQGEGGFNGVLCTPCYEMLTTGEAKHGETFIHKLESALRWYAKAQVNNAHPSLRGCCDDGRFARCVLRGEEP